MNNYPIKRPKNPTDAALDVISIENTATDPLGMYTGVPANKDEKPVQDSDDL